MACISAAAWYLRTIKALSVTRSPFFGPSVAVNAVPKVRKMSSAKQSVKIHLPGRSAAQTGAHPCHICTRTGLTPAPCAPGLRTPRNMCAGAPCATVVLGDGAPIRMTCQRRLG